MAFDITTNALIATQKINIEPQISLEIEGISTIYGARLLQKRAIIGNPDLFIDGTWKIGGLYTIADQDDLISLEGSTTSIKQELNQDKTAGSTISSMEIGLVDKEFAATQIISPGILVTDILGRRAKIWLGFRGTSFPQDYIPIFRGVIDDIVAGPGLITLNIAHPDLKKKQTLFQPATTTLSSAINNSTTTIPVISSADFILQNTADPDHLGYGLRCFMKIDDEIIEYHGALTGCTRGALGTTAASHLGPVVGPPAALGADVQTFYALEGNVIDLALRLFMSDHGANPYVSDVPVGSYNYIDSVTTTQDTIFFRQLDLVEKYGVQVGDFVYLSGSVSGGVNNNTTYALVIESIETRFDGTVLTITLPSGHFTTEITSTALARFKSQYNLLGVGLGMKPDEVDIDEHIRLQQLYLASFSVRIYLKDPTDVKELIENELYAVCGAYALPRKSKSSLGYHIGPIPGANLQTLNGQNVTNPDKLKVRRSVANNFYNTIVYQFEKNLFTDEFTRGVITQDATSLVRIPMGVKARTIEALGLRDDLNGSNLATQASNRLLNRYKFAAEYIEDMKVLFSIGYNIEIGDIILLDGASLQIVNTVNGNRSPVPVFYEVYNKTVNLKTGEISLSLCTTNYSTSNRYGLIGPSSKIKSSVSANQILIKPGTSTVRYGSNEYLKWLKYVTTTGSIGVVVRSPDSATRVKYTTITAIEGNKITFADNLGFTPLENDFMEISKYSNAVTTAQVKSIYGFMRDSAFGDGGQQYLML